jgi:uncharacterized protein
MICESQKEVVEFLSAPKNFGGAAVQRIDTHLSHVFLVGARAYKIKRAIKYDFVDFSTAALRRRACENEVRINRRTAPEMYLGVVPLYHGEYGVSWEGVEEAIEWAVEMVRFEPGNQLDELLSRGEVAEKTILRLADKIAQFHREAERKVCFRPQADIGFVLDQLATSLNEHEIYAGRERDVERWASLARVEYKNYSSFLNARRRHGWVRHCHGDLHLANICMFAGEPTPFDAIEFNEDIANIDVLYDLAFLLMDLISHNRSAFANLLLNRYLSVTRDYAGLSLLRLFQSMRAAVRAMVLSLPGQSHESKKSAGRYLDLALEYLIGEAEPRLIAIGGYSGTGKSTLARKLALEFGDRCGAVVLRSDVIRKHMQGRAPEEPLGVESYSSTLTANVYRAMFKYAYRALRAGRPVILDATFLDPQFRDRAESLARKADVQFQGLWLTAPRDILMERVWSRSADASDATVSILEQQLQLGREPAGWEYVDASGDYHETLENTLSVFPTNNE